MDWMEMVLMCLAPLLGCRSMKFCMFMLYVKRLTNTWMLRMICHQTQRKTDRHESWT